MNTERKVFAQLVDFLPMLTFRRCVQKYRGNYKVRCFSCLDQFLCMAFEQLIYRESFRDIEAFLLAVQTRLYHIVKKQPHLDLSLYTILQILSVTVFEKSPILQVLKEFARKEPKGECYKQLSLFD
jgi:hypothetical protein